MITVAMLVNGVVIGCGYAVLVLGWTLVLGAARVANFAHGQFFMLGAFVTWWTMTTMSAAYPVAILVTLVVAALVGALAQLVMIRMTVAQDLVRIMIVTLGFSYLITASATLIFGGNAHRVDSPLEVPALSIGGAALSVQDLLVTFAAFALFALTALVLENTRVGRVICAVAEDPLLAELGALRPYLVYVGVFAFSALLAALAGALLATRGPVFTTVGSEQMILTFVIVVLGGVGRVWGNLFAAVGVGLFTSIFGSLVSPAYTTGVLFLGILILFAIRPQGVQVH